MKAAIVAWTCLVLSGGVYAEDYIAKNGVGFLDTFRVRHADQHTLRWEVVLAPEELDRIREACK